MRWRPRVMPPKTPRTFPKLWQLRHVAETTTPFASTSPSARPMTVHSDTRTRGASLTRRHRLWHSRAAPRPRGRAAIPAIAGRSRDSEPSRVSDSRGSRSRQRLGRYDSRRQAPAPDAVGVSASHSPASEVGVGRLGMAARAELCESRLCDRPHRDEPRPYVAQRAHELVHLTLRVPRCWAEPQPLRAAWDGGIVDRLHVDTMREHQIAGNLFTNNRISDQDRNDVRFRAHHGKLRLGEKSLQA